MGKHSCALERGAACAPCLGGTAQTSLGVSLQVDEVTDLLASFTSLSLQMQSMEKR